jgi:2-polyprenyl-6-methoxyphenol hydroxylase-like FAD-dependent oxidoreductase
VSQRHAVVVGAGVGGLAAAVGLEQHGWDVTVLERGGHLTGGAGISLWPNGLAALAELGVQDRVLAGAVLGGRSGVRTPGGKWIARSDIAGAVRSRYGRPLVLTRRETLLQALAGRLASRPILFGVTAVDVTTAGQWVSVQTDGEVYGADLVVIADGARSQLRPKLFPGHPGVRYAGYTSWRLIAVRPGGPVDPAETWGQNGHRFAVLPLSDDYVYCYATANVAQGQRTSDERRELQRRFGRWHQPIPQIIDSLTPSDVIRTDIVEIAKPLTVLHRGRALLLGDAAHAMTPDLGQGGCQSLEDAATLAALAGPATSIDDALQQYSDQRARRGADLVRRSRRSGRLYQAPPLVARTVARLVNHLPATALVRPLAPVLDWRPPASVPGTSDATPSTPHDHP